MNEIRRLFLESAAQCRELLARSEVAERWEEPSALELFSIRGLSGHLVRATGSVEAYLDRGEPDGANVVSAAQYYAAAVATPDPTSELHVAVRARGEAEAAEGHAALVARLDGIVDRLSVRLETEPGERLVRVFQDLILSLDDYLVTRLVEQLVHMDDLAVSIGVDTPDPPRGASDVVVDALVDVARHRHGDLAVLRALTRRERDPEGVLRVL